MTVEEGLILSRFLHFAALLFVFGSALFPLYAFTAGESQTSAGLTHRLRRWIFAACLLAFVSSVAWLVFASASMAGSLSEALSPDMIGTVLLATAFGKVWSAHLALVATLAIVARLDKERRPVSLAILSAACLASLAGVGHTQAQDGARLFGAHRKRRNSFAGSGGLAWRSCSASRHALAAGRTDTFGG